MQEIAASNLIVADLTDSNPNVFYELGLAHAFKKPVILLTQEIADLPFDLRSYRVISYGTHFTQMDHAKQQLTDLLTEFDNGTAKFGSPVTDFAIDDMILATADARDTANDSSAGFLDYLSEMEQGFENLEALIADITENTIDLGKRMSIANERLDDLQNNPTRGQIRQTRSVVIGLAQNLNQYAASLSSINEKYINELDKTSTALESVVRAQEPKTPEERANLEQFLIYLRDLEDTIQESVSEVEGFADILRAVPQIERRFNRAKEHTLLALRRLNGAMAQTVSVLARVQSIGDDILKTDGNPS